MVALRTQNLISALTIACAFALASSVLRSPGVNAEVAAQPHRGDCEISRALEVSSSASTCTTTSSESSDDFVSTMIEEFVTVSIAMVLGFAALHSVKAGMMMHHATRTDADKVAPNTEKVDDDQGHEAVASSASSSETSAPTIKKLEVAESPSSLLDHDNDASTAAGDSDGHADPADSSDSNADDSDVEETGDKVVSAPKWQDDEKLSWRRAAALEQDRLKENGLRRLPPISMSTGNRQSPLAKLNTKASTKPPAKSSGEKPTLSAGGLALLSLLREEQRDKLMSKSSGNADTSSTPPGLTVPARATACPSPIRPPPGLEAFGPNQIA